MERTEQGLTKNQVISELTRSPHGELGLYLPVGTKAAIEDPTFFAHLIAWNEKNGKIRDAKVALPIIALQAPTLNEPLASKTPGLRVDLELRDNALAHVVSLDPRNLARAVRFARSLPVPRRLLHRTVERYLRAREESPAWFERTALQHRKSLQELYALLHVKPAEGAQKILFDNAKTGVFADVASLANMAPDEIAGTIARRKIPFLVARGALGAKIKDPAVVQALITAMSPTELVTNAKALEKLGIKNVPALRAAFEAGLQKVAASNVATLKTTTAAAAIGGSTGEKLRGAQEKQLDAIGVQGDWAVFGDKSSSMHLAIESARQVAGFLARVAKGKVHLIFFNESPEYHDVTGKSLDEIAALTKRVTANGMTGIGCGLEYLAVKGVEVDGIAIVSDGGENQSPAFAQAYTKYVEKFGKEVPVYFYKLPGDPDSLSLNCQKLSVVLNTFDLTNGVDYYSLPSLVQTMSTNRFSLVDAILATPLLRLEDVFKKAA